MAGGQPGCWVYRKTGYDTARSSAAIRPSMGHDTTQEVRDTAGRAETRRGPERDTARQHERAGSDTVVHRRSRQGTSATRSGRGPRYGPAWATTWRSAQPRLWVAALCTRLSFDSVHCSESLFGTLFIDTVHEHCSRGLKKIKKKYFKMK